MWNWYRSAKICFAYLEDVHSNTPDKDDALSNSKWFRRGWTLQELLAPDKIIFYSSTWDLLGKKMPKRCIKPDSDEYKFIQKLSNITRIDFDCLIERDTIHQKSAAQRMGWASQRETKRLEDRAYSLMGIFNINMPIIYGEGPAKAMKRLQLEILQQTPDQTLFAWGKEKSTNTNPVRTGFLARSPDDFQDCNFFNTGVPLKLSPEILSFSVTNVGLRINLPIQKSEQDGKFIASLHCGTSTNNDTKERVRIELKKLKFKRGADLPIYQRVDNSGLIIDNWNKDVGKRENIYILDEDQSNHLRIAGLLVSEAREVGRRV
jgi:hypothetical protein